MFLLPVAFGAVMYWGFSAFDFIFSSLGLNDFESIPLSGYLAAAILSFFAFFWIFALASGRSATSVWKPVLSLHLKIIFPASLIYMAQEIVLTILELYLLREYLLFLWVVTALILVFYTVKMFQTSLLTTYIGEKFWPWHAVLLVVGGFDVFVLSAYLVFMVSAV